MIPVEQTKFVIKNECGVMIRRGNCFPACIASILELPITEVPNLEVLYHIPDRFDYFVLYEFLKSYGYEINNNNDFNVFHNPCFFDNPEEIKEKLKDKYYLASGPTVRGTNHVVVYQNGVMIHDPYPTKEGLLSIEYFEEITKLS